MACAQQLDAWWQQWQCDEAAAGGKLVHQYACMFKHWGHLEAKEQYLFGTTVPQQLQRLLLQLRCFNIKLATHTHNWGGRTEQQRGPNCRLCHMDAVESEYHLLFECPAYADIRTKYGVPNQAHACMFTGDDAKRTARFLRCALRRRLDGATHELDGADDPGVVVTGSHMLMYVATWWLICCMVVPLLLWTLLRALDAYRVL